jgi:exonuclease SbcC
LRLAISQMIADRAGQPFTLLVLDEILGSLDPAHQHRVLGLLRGLEGRFEQVIVMSHVEGTRDDFDHVIEIVYDEVRGSSRVIQQPSRSYDYEPEMDAVPAGAES